MDDLEWFRRKGHFRNILGDDVHVHVAHHKRAKHYNDTTSIFITPGQLDFYILYNLKSGFLCNVFNGVTKKNCESIKQVVNHELEKKIKAM